MTAAAKYLYTVSYLRHGEQWNQPFTTTERQPDSEAKQLASIMAGASDEGVAMVGWQPIRQGKARGPIRLIAVMDSDGNEIEQHCEECCRKSQEEE
jgi:hypothetical protein